MGRSWDRGRIWANLGHAHFEFGTGTFRKIDKFRKIEVRAKLGVANLGQANLGRIWDRHISERDQNDKSPVALSATGDWIERAFRSLTRVD